MAIDIRGERAVVFNDNTVMSMHIFDFSAHWLEGVLSSGKEVHIPSSAIKYIADNDEDLVGALVSISDGDDSDDDDDEIEPL